jgi:hypothetical protein
MVDVFTVALLALRWRCKPHTILAEIHAERLDAFPLRPGAKRPTWRITKENVLRFERGHQHQKSKPKRRKSKRHEAGFVKYY